VGRADQRLKRYPSGMRILALAPVLLAAACGPAATSTTRLDDDHAAKVHCPDGYTYTVVETRTRALASGPRATPAPVTDTAALCARLRRY